MENSEDARCLSCMDLDIECLHEDVEEDQDE